MENALKIANVEVAAWALQTQKAIDTETFGNFMDAANVKLAKKEFKYSPSLPVTVKFHQLLINIVADVGDVALANSYWSNFFKPEDEKTELVSAITEILRAFTWDDISEAFIDSFAVQEAQSYFRTMDDTIFVLILLQVADRLDKRVTRDALLQQVVNKAATFSEKVLLEHVEIVELLCKWAVQCDDIKILEAVANKFKKMDGSLLRPVMDEFSKFISVINSSADKFALVASVAAVRIAWLKLQIQKLDTIFVVHARCQVSGDRQSARISTRCGRIYDHQGSAKF